MTNRTEMLLATGALSLLLLAPGASLADGPTREQQSTQSKASASQSKTRASSSRSSSSRSSGSRSSSATRGTSSAHRNDSGRARSDRRDTSDWRGYDHYRRPRTQRTYGHSHYPGYYPRRPHYYGSYLYWGPWSYYPWSYYYPPTVRIYSERPNSTFGALDLDVAPDDTQVFVDGGYVGEVDDFDGFPTYLWLEEGTYDIVLYREGHETLFRQYTVRPGLIIDVNDRLRPGVAQLPDEVMTPTSTINRDRRMAREAERQEEARRMEAMEAERRNWSPPGDLPERDEDLGRFAFRVWPADAAVYLDGHFLGTGYELGQLSAGLLVGAGDHEIEVVRPGYETWTGDESVSAGELLEIEVELEQD